MSSQLKALEAFTEQNPDLLRLESLLKRFNLFEAVGVVRHELRHSDFLAYLLDPGQNHGLGSTFLKEFLQAVRLTIEDDAILSLFDLDTLNLSKAVVFREWHHVDILVVDDLNHFAVIIENKIGTGEHSDQLNRYYKDFYSFYGYKAVALYLTPDGDLPVSDTDHVYHAVSYTLVCEVIEKIAQNNRAALDGEIIMVLEHYAQMLRRHIVSDSDIADLCRSIYQKHKQALDLIIEHRPDQKAQIKQYIESLIQQNPDISFNYNRGYVVFSLHEWQNSPRHGGEFGDNICWMLYFEFNNTANSLVLDLKITPGDKLEREKHRQMAQDYRFRGYSSKLTGNYSKIASKIASVSFLTGSDYEKTQEEIESLISEKWDEYLRDELPRIVGAVRQEEWLWAVP